MIQTIVIYITVQKHDRRKIKLCVREEHKPVHHTDQCMTDARTYKNVSENIVVLRKVEK